MHNVFGDVRTSQPHSSSTVSSSSCPSHRISSIWFPFVALAILFTLSDLCLPLVEAGCRTNSGSPMCCRGRQTACHSTTWVDGPNKNLINQHVHNVVEKRCYCDEHCVTTRDCCPDYHEVCRKFSELNKYSMLCLLMMNSPSYSNGSLLFTTYQLRIKSKCEALITYTTKAFVPVLLFAPLKS